MKFNENFYKVLLTFSMLLFASFSFSQVKLKGRVTDEQKLGIPGVIVKEKGTTNLTSTDTNGDFSIAVSSDQSKLTFNYIGKKMQELIVGSQRVFNVTLEEESRAMDEVLVIGYGTQSREKITTSVSKLDMKVLENVPLANVASALQGTLPGVRVQSTSGQPGAAPRVIIRGGTSINNPNGAAPLYIVDGIIRSDINNLNSNDIESLQVLKDAASTAIYGSRGANGVVLVTTKSGKAGAVQINYGYDLGISTLQKKYSMLNARDFIYYQRLGIAARAAQDPSQLVKLGLATSGGAGNDLTNKTAYTTQYLTAANGYKLNEGWESMVDPTDPARTIIFKNTDFQDVLFSTGKTNNHNLSVSGGSEKAKFNLGLGYLDNEGIAISTDYKRLTLNMNGELQATDNLSVFGRVLYSNMRNTQVFGKESDMFGRSLALAPTAKFTYEDGSLAPGLGATIGNPLYYESTIDAKNSTDNLSLSVGGKWTITKDLNFTPQVSIYQVTDDNRSFQGAYYNGPASYIDSRVASGGYNKTRQHQAEGVFSYNKTFLEKHELEAKLGFSYFQTEKSSLSASGRGAASDLIPTLNGSAMPVSVSGSESQLRIMGYFSRINYNYLEKYLLSFNLRYDGASNLGDKKWGFFPGISAGWNVHKEAFWSGISDKISQFKLRASYGVNGNIGQLGYYDAQGQYSVGAQYNGAAAVQNTALSNPALTWEQSKTLNFGTDLGFFNGRVNLMLDVYRRVTDNLLTNMSLPHSTGFASVLTNLGSLENKGIELELSGRVFPQNSAFGWNISLNAAKVKNKILELPNNGIPFNRIGGDYVYNPKIGDYAWMGGLQEGGKPGDIYAYKQIGIYATDEEAAKGPKDTVVPLADKTKYGGDVNWEDVDGNGLIDSRDRVYVGNIYPKWTGGFTNTFNYKNFGLLVRFDYTAGHVIYNYTEAASVGQFQGENGLSSTVLRSWQKQGDVTDIPRFYWADQQARSNIFRGNSYYYEKGDYLALREVTLSYVLPQAILNKLKIGQLRLNLSGSNLHYFTNYVGQNPEDGGTDNGRYPVPRTIVLGANLTF
ncbi:TonB-dependent receptor [Pedobacter gandavensis]|uniref:SusC/RagA family TonB-linked outer membrane protein n=1 Tax=Pedobacter gandavensis TaxID=2679963 RepID=UPI002478AAD4|nr:TonB-dependent receptor [Pedobacter gandavensis]WGQ10604.1 TonB-dependent receptor [Pedobacter gandavensis]